MTAPSEQPVRSRFIPTDDGQQLYVTEVADAPGRPVLVCCNGVGVSTFLWSYLISAFRDRYRIVLWDYRGHGRSTLPEDPENADFSIERSARDLAHVLEATGLVDDDPVLIGHSMGCQVILQYAADHPSVPHGLVPMLGTFARPLDTLLDSPVSKPIFDVVHRLALGAGRGGRRLFRPLVGAPWAIELARRSGLVDREHVHGRDLQMYMDHLNQLDPRVLFGTVAQMADHDLTDRLADILCPVLVIAAENDIFTPLHRSEEMARLLPNAELFVLAEGSHAALIEHPDTIERRLDRFLSEISADADGGDDDSHPLR